MSVGEHKTAELRHIGGGRFEAITGSGFRLEVDDEAGGTAPRPTELLVVAIGGCTAMDVASILAKKRQDVSSYRVSVRAEQRASHPKAFVRVEIVHRVEGPAVTPEAVRRSIELSATRYCSVSTTLAAGVTAVHHRFVVVSPEGSAPVEGEVLVTGPSLVIPPDPA
jgi:putative redox protein